MNPILLSGLVGAVVGGTAAILSQFVADWLAKKRELGRFRVQSFERFRREFSEDPTLRAIATKYYDIGLKTKRSKITWGSLRRSASTPTETW